MQTLRAAGLAVLRPMAKGEISRRREVVGLCAGLACGFVAFWWIGKGYANFYEELPQEVNAYIRGKVLVYVRSDKFIEATTDMGMN